MIDAAVEQGRIAHRQLQRRDRDALAEADRHGLERTPARAGCQRAAALPEFDRNRTGEAHLLQPFFLPHRAELVGDLRGADVGAFLHDLGNRADAAERVGVVDQMAIGGKDVGAIILLPE